MWYDAALCCLLHNVAWQLEDKQCYNPLQLLTGFYRQVINLAAPYLFLYCKGVWWNWNPKSFWRNIRQLDVTHYVRQLQLHSISYKYTIFVCWIESLHLKMHVQNNHCYSVILMSYFNGSDWDGCDCAMSSPQCTSLPNTRARLGTNMN